MNKQVRVFAIIGGVVLVAAAGFTLVLVASLASTDFDSRAVSMDADAALRTAAHAARIGVADGSVAWDAKTHTVSSSGFTASSTDLTHANFDVWAGTFCISATNGHRITNASNDVESGTCPRPAPTRIR